MSSHPLVSMGWTASNLMKCHGDYDYDFDCNPGLYCFHRSDLSLVPGFISGGAGDISGMDYCVERPSSNPSNAPSESSSPMISYVSTENPS